MQTDLFTPVTIAPPVNQRAKILKALIEKPYISEGADFPGLNGFRIRLTEIRRELETAGVFIHSVKHTFQGEFSEGWCKRHFLLSGDRDKAVEVYDRINK